MVITGEYEGPVNGYYWGVWGTSQWLLVSMRDQSVVITGEYERLVNVYY